MKRWILRGLLSALPVLLLYVPVPGGGTPPNSSFLTHLRYLASDELKGRGNNRPEIDRAAEYVARQFQELGLQPAGDKGGYFQSFQVIAGYELGPGNRFAFRTEAEQLEPELGSEYVPLSFGPVPVVEAPVVFAGFGISAPELNYDDYREIDVRGKVVLLFDHEPQERMATSKFGGSELTPYATVMSKLLNAKHRGAAAVVLLPDSDNHPEGIPFKLDQPLPIEDLGLHSVRVNERIARWVLGKSRRDQETIRRSIHSHLTPYSFALDGVRARIALDVVKARYSLKNVLALIPGRTEEVIILGAHYDHLGLGDKSSLAPEQSGEIHNGADDNASGTAGLLQLAEDFAGTEPHRSLLFIAFAGEELGLLGSQYYAEHPRFPLGKTVAMINMDMIGRSRGDLLIGGIGTAAEFRTILQKLQQDSPLRFRNSESPRGSSDHLSFSLKRVPVLFFFSGLHSDYHKPTDDWEKIDLERAHQVLGVVRQCVQEVDRLEVRPQFADRANEQLLAEAGGRSYGPQFGMIPDLNWDSGGVRFLDVALASPAFRAGLQAGDVLIEFHGKSIENLNDFTEALSRAKEGEEVKVMVLRGNDPVQAVVRLEPRH